MSESSRHWDTTYANELSNHAANPSDSGTVWFADSDASPKILAYLESLSQDGLLDPSSARFLDLGTGNGHMLLELREEGWTGEMLGVDYSEGSVSLARNVAAAVTARSETMEEESVIEGAEVDDNAVKEVDVGEEACTKALHFAVWDILHDEPVDWLGEGFDVVLDKGTFDAISLSAEMDGVGRRACESYRERVERLVKVGGFLLVTSCNWTEEELRGWFDQGKLAYWGRLKYPTFTFGGVKGQTICSLCLRRQTS
ncbi:MAG: hypothetical protein Q9157_006284 [Trypethelium eluteriae]